jgi:NodT family efflux transporter outer membrane factor (OMF) lipoprotein
MSKTDILKLLACGCAAATLTACGTLGPDFQKPAAPSSAESYAMQGEAGPAGVLPGGQLAGTWWSIYNSPEIDATVRQALEGNRSLEAARATLAQARGNVIAQDRALTGDASASFNFEHINFAAFGFSGFPGVELTNPTVTLYSFGANAKYDFDLFGQMKREHESREAQAEAQAFQTDAAYLTLTAQVVSQALAIASLRAQIAAWEDITATDQSNLDIVTKAYQLGGGSKLDVSTVETELAADESQVAPLRQQLAQARHQLALLVGKAPADWSPPDFDLDRIAQPASVPLALPSELVRARPDIRQAESRLHAATAQIGVAQADLYPKLTLSASLAQSALHPEDLFSYDKGSGWSIAPGVSLPIFNRGALKARQRMAEDAARAAVATNQQTVLPAFVQVADALQAIGNDDVAIRSETRATGASQTSLRLQRLRYKDGKTGLLPVLDAQRSYARARVSLAQARARRMNDVAQLLYATGRSVSVTPAQAAPAA